MFISTGHSHVGPKFQSTPRTHLRYEPESQKEKKKIKDLNIFRPIRNGYAILSFQVDTEPHQKYKKGWFDQVVEEIRKGLRQQLQRGIDR